MTMIHRRSRVNRTTLAKIRLGGALSFITGHISGAPVIKVGPRDIATGWDGNTGALLTVGATPTNVPVIRIPDFLNRPE